MKVLWTPTARTTYLEIIEYFEENWSNREILRFNSKVEKTIKQIEKNPRLFVASKHDENIRRGFVVKQISLIYRIVPEKNQIHLIAFWDNRRNPKNLKYLLQKKKLQ